MTKQSQVLAASVRGTQARVVGLGLLAALCLSCSGDSSGGTSTGPLVRLHPSPIDPAATQATLTIMATDPTGQSAQRTAPPFTSAPFDPLGVTFPAGTRGASSYQLNLTDGNGCLLSAGTAILSIDSDTTYDLTVPMTVTPLCGNGATLSVQVAGLNGGSGTVTSTPAGINCQGAGNGCSMVFAKGTPITLMAQASAGTFESWSGGCTGTGACSFTLGQDTQVQGLFSACHGWCKEQLPAAITANLNSISGTGASDILVVGDSGTAVHWNGTTWQQLTPPSGSSVALRAAAARPGATTTYVAGDGGTILTLANGTFTPITNTSMATLRGIAVGAGATTNIAFVGDGGTGLLLANGGTMVTAQNPKTTLNLFAIAQDPTNAAFYLVGAINNGKGFAERWDGMSAVTVQMNSGGANIPGNINAVTAGPLNIYAAGDGGAIVTRASTGGGTNANNWSTVAAGLTTQNLRGLWESADNSIYAVGDSGTILQYDGVSWTKAVSGTTTNLRAAWGSNAVNVYVVGDSGTVLHYLP